VTVRRPTRTELADLNGRLGLGIAEDLLDEFVDAVDEALTAHDWLDAIDEPAPQATRAHGHHPAEADNPLGAWYWKTSISKDVEGPLAGKTLVVKDNICVAGTPMMNGSKLLEGYVPEQDATVVRRALDAGATVVGKAVCESLCYSGGSHTSDTGPVRNPYDVTRSSGGSSSGCAALLANGEVDLAIGSDQGGSIRGPCSWSGVFGLKPTFGLVPYTAAFPLEMTIDHLGPMARNAADVALLLDVLAGPDGLDPRQTTSTPAPDAMAALSQGANGLRLGLLVEGFGWGVSEPDVENSVREAARQLAGLGASLDEVSVPWHRHGGKLTHAIAAGGSTALLVHSNGLGTNWKGRHVASMGEAFARGRRTRPDGLPAMAKLQALVGQWVLESCGGRHYAIAQNAARRLARAYDDALESVDLLVMPTTPLKATLLPPPDISEPESTRIGHQMGANTAPFNVTGHPAMSVPCASSEGLPVGMMLVGRRGEDATVTRAAHAFETQIFRLPPPVPDRSRPEERAEVG
jgi:amidase